MSRKLVPLKYFILYRCSIIAFISLLYTISQKVLMWKSFGQNFNRNFILPHSNVFQMSPETFVTFFQNLNNLSYSTAVC